MMKDWQAALVLFMTMAAISLLPHCAQAADKWSSRDIGLEITYQVLNVVDAGQTAAIGDSPHYHEVGMARPFLGNNPSEVGSAAYFAATGLLHVGITHLLPSKWRPVWQGVTITVQGANVLRNHAIGLRWGF